MGRETNAQGDYSTAMGRYTEATGFNSFASGSSSIASGTISFSFGSSSVASGDLSIAFGHHVIAPSAIETVIGSYNTIYTPVDNQYFNSADRLFVIGNGETEASRSDALVLLKNGNLGLGTSTPTEKLHVNGNLRVDGEFRQGSSDYGGYEIQTSGEIYTNNYLVAMGGIHVGGASDPGTDNLVVDGTISGNGSLISNLSASNISSGTISDSRLESYIDRTRFNASDYITALGGIHVGGTADPGTNNLIVDGSTTVHGNTTVNGILYLTRSAPYMVFTETETSYTKKWYMGLDGKGLFIRENSTAGSNERFVMEENGNIGLGVADPRVKLDLVGSIYYTGSCTDVSDVKLKTNIRTIENVLFKLKQLNGVYYHFKDTAKYGAAEQIGMIAQDMQKVFPQLVNEIEEDLLGINYIDFSAVLLQAIKEQQQIIENQNSEQKDFKNRINELKARKCQTQTKTQ